MSEDKLFHWHGTVAEFDAEVRRRWIASSEQLGLDHGMPNAAAALAAQQPQPAPEPPFPGDLEPVMTPAVARPSFGSTLVLAVGDAPDDSVRKLEDALTAATEGEGVTVVTVRGVEALRTWEPPPAPELAEVAAKLAEVAAERDKLLAAPGQRELDSLCEKLEAAEQEAADVRACAVGTFALIAVLARDNPAAQRQANELRQQIGILPSPPEAEIAELPPSPELVRAMGVIAAYEDLARRMIVPDATARAELRERHGVEPAPELVAADNIALRDLLDEIGTLAANAPEDGDSFGLLEEIAMRIAAADVPDSEPEAAAAPELAAAGSEATDLRAVIDMIWRMCQNPKQAAGTSQGVVVNGERLAERISGLIKNSGMEPF